VFTLRGGLLSQFAPGFSDMRKQAAGALRHFPKLWAERLSEAESVEMLLSPRLHLDYLLSGQSEDMHHLTSIAGVFNVATALAHMRRDLRSIPYYEAALVLLLDIARNGLHEQANAHRLRRYFNSADDYLLRHSRPELQRAVHLVRQQILSGQATPLLAA